MLALPSLLFCLSLGLSLGVLGGMLGIGGGLVAIPILARLYGMNQQLAQGTALIMIVPNVVVGFVRYRQRHPMALRQLGLVVVPAALAAWVSSRWAVAADATLLRRLFAVFLVAIAVSLLVGRGRDGAHSEAKAPLLPMTLTPLIGVVSGLMSGFFTVGGGLVVVPALVLLFGVAQVEAQGIALATVVPGVVVALCSYAGAGHANWSIGLPMAIGGVITVSTGVAIAHRMPPRLLSASFTTVLLGTALALLV